MATFQIHQDAEKENPHIAAPLKEKTLLGAGVGRPNALQPSVLGGVGGMGGAFKEKHPQLLQQQGTRSNFAVLNSKASSNVGHGHGARMSVGSKVAFRELGNVKANEEKAASFAAAAAAAKKTVVPVVEQFKSFSVYEDQTDFVSQQQQRQQHVGATHSNSNATAAATAAACIQVEKENVFVEQQRLRTQIEIKCDSIHKDFASDDDYVLDTTPMSVSDVLSPMSVDRSQVQLGGQLSTSQLIDDNSDCKKVAELQHESQHRQLSLPRNDRQRFFEVVDYQREILEYFRESEKKHRPKPHYMRRQSDINYSMRTILVDWLVEVSEEYNLDTETLYLSVSYIDRFLSHMSVVRSKLQLVGTAAMYIASKYEEIYPPDVSEFVFITDDTYNKAQVLRMEQIILKILAFDLCTPTVYVFISTYAVLADMTDRLKFLTQYICELSLLEADPYLRFYPSLISAAAHALARYVLDYAIWSTELEEITTYHLEDLKEVFLYLCKSHNAATTLAQQAIQEKYKADKYKKVSSIKPVELDEAQFDEIARKYNEVVASDDASKEQKSRAANSTGTSNENVRRMISLMFN